MSRSPHTKKGPVSRAGPWSEKRKVAVSSGFAKARPDRKPRGNCSEQNTKLLPREAHVSPQVNLNCLQQGKV